MEKLLNGQLLNKAEDNSYELYFALFFEIRIQKGCNGI